MPPLQALRSADIFPLLRRLEICGSGTMEGDRARLLLDMVAWRRTHGVLESFALTVTLMEPRDVPAAAAPFATPIHSHVHVSNHNGSSF